MTTTSTLTIRKPRDVASALRHARYAIADRPPMQAAHFLIASGRAAGIHPSSVRLWVQVDDAFPDDLQVIAIDRDLWRSIDRRVARHQEESRDDGLTALKTVVPLTQTPDNPRHRNALATLPLVWRTCRDTYGDQGYVAIDDLCASLNISRPTAISRLTDLEELGAISRRRIAGRSARTRIRPASRDAWRMWHTDERALALARQLDLVATVFTHPAIHYGNVLDSTDPLYLVWAALGVSGPGSERTHRRVRARLRSLDIHDFKSALSALDAQAGDSPECAQAAAEKRKIAREANAMALEELRLGYSAVANLFTDAVRDAKRAGRPAPVRPANETIRRIVAEARDAVEAGDVTTLPTRAHDAAANAISGLRRDAA